jgi:hypothetical protein
MATIAEQLTSLANTKTAIKNAIVAKGVAVADTDPFSAYAGKIGQISGGGGASEEWQPNPNWWDIKKILDEDTRDYPGKVGVILYDFNDVSDFTLTNFAVVAVATSDGAFYSYADNGSTVSHNWDTTQDKDDGKENKTRWVIYYYTTDTTSDIFQQADKKFGWAYNCIAYLVLRINCSSGSNFCNGQRLLEAIDNVGYTISGTNFSYFCSNCYSLTKLPDGLDTSNGTNFNYFCSNCYSLTKLPDGLDTSNGTNFGYFCTACYSLAKLPDGLDTSNGTNFSYFCRSCHVLPRLPDGLDTSNGTNFNYFCATCYVLQEAPEITMAANTTNYTSRYSAPFNSSSWIKELPLTLPSDTNFWLDMSTRISIESFRYIADHAPDVTATPRTLTVGSTNISRINAADPTIITDLNAKGWTIA